MPSRFARYVAGEHETVWRELVRLGPRVYETPDEAEAEAIAHETMTRARRNVEILVDRLPTLGWTFRFALHGPPTDYCVYGPPRQDAAEKVAQLERLTGGRMPLSIRAWWTVVGTVCFMRRPPTQQESVLPDPLVVDPIEAVLAEFHEWRADDERRRLEPRFRAPIAPDELHKDDISGGAPYEIELPHAGADAPLLNEWHGTTFVGYVRRAFECAGLPGWCRDERSALTVRELAASLTPL